MLERTVRIGQLFDFYGYLLTEKQREMVTLYHFDNLSLGEIGEKFNITRQAVYDHLQTAEKTLQEYEEILGLIRKEELQREVLREIRRKLQDCSSSAARDSLELLEKLEKVHEGNDSIDLQQTL